MALYAPLKFLVADLGYYISDTRCQIILLERTPTYRIQDTAIGTVELEHDGIIVIRIKEHKKLDPSAMHDSMAARIKMAAGVKRPVMIVLHPTFDLHVSLPKSNRGELLHASTLCEAIVASTNANENASKVYYRYFRPPFACNVFRDEKLARNWLLEHV